MHNLSPRLMERPNRVQREHLLAGLSNIYFFKPLHTRKSHMVLSRETGNRVVEACGRKSRCTLKGCTSLGRKWKEENDLHKWNSLNRKNWKIQMEKAVVVVRREREIISCLMLINAVLKWPADFWEYFSTTAGRKTRLDKSVIELEPVKLDILEIYLRYTSSNWGKKNHYSCFVPILPQKCIRVL